MKLFRLKSNPESVVKEIPDWPEKVKLVWNENSGTEHGWIYSKLPDNMTELTEAEVTTLQTRIDQFNKQRRIHQQLNWK